MHINIDKFQKNKIQKHESTGAVLFRDLKRIRPLKGFIDSPKKLFPVKQMQEWCHQYQKELEIPFKKMLCFAYMFPKILTIENQ